MFCFMFEQIKSFTIKKYKAGNDKTIFARTIKKILKI